MTTPKEKFDSDLVCAKCGVWCREEREARDDDGQPFHSWTVCAYCGLASVTRRKFFLDKKRGRVWGDIELRHKTGWV